jgi:hypothetical protein
VEIIFLRGAEADLLSAWVRYEEALTGLGERFGQPVFGIFNSIDRVHRSLIQHGLSRVARLTYAVRDAGVATGILRFSGAEFRS